MANPVLLPASLSSGRRHAPSVNEIPVLSFFTGAGFLDLGLASAGFRSVWHNEYDSAFVEGFEYAMAKAPGTHLGSRIVESRDSIIDTAPGTIARAALGTRRGQADFGMVGGPPCPDFSVGGKNRGEKGEQGRLTEVYIDRIAELKPAFFVLENVPGLVRTKKHREFFERVMFRLNPDYLYGWSVVNALDHGAPQDRSRVIAVGLNRTVLRKLYGRSLAKRMSGTWQPDFAHLASHPKALSAYSWPRLSEVSGDVIPVNVPAELTVGNAFSAKAGRLPSDLPNGNEGFTPKSSKFKWIKEGDDSKKSFKRLHRWRYSPAAAYGNNEVHIHPTLPRRITVREAMRIQTVPDWYSLPGEMTLTKKFKTVGNGVPVVLARNVALYLREILDGSADFER